MQQVACFDFTADNKRVKPISYVKPMQNKRLCMWRWTVGVEHLHPNNFQSSSMVDELNCDVIRLSVYKKRQANCHGTAHGLWLDTSCSKHRWHVSWHEAFEYRVDRLEIICDYCVITLLPFPYFVAHTKPTSNSTKPNKKHNFNNILIIFLTYQRQNI